jgi:predicted permease
MQIAVHVFLSVLRSLGEVVTLVAAGIYLTRKGLLDAGARAKLSQISANLAVPCLLFTSLAADVDLEVLTQQGGWVIALLPFIYVPLGLLVGRITVWAARPADDFRSGAIAAIAFGNSTGLPIVLLSVIEKQIPTPQGSATPISFLSLYLICYPCLQWSLGYWLLKPRQGPSVTTSKDSLVAKFLAPAVTNASSVEKAIAWWQATYTYHSPDEMLAFADANCVFSCPSFPGVDKIGEYAKIMVKSLGAFPDMRGVLEEVRSVSDAAGFETVTLKYSFHGTFSGASLEGLHPNGNSFSVDGAFAILFDTDGRICNVKKTYDRSELFAQLQNNPAPFADIILNMPLTDNSGGIEPSKGLNRDPGRKWVAALLRQLFPPPVLGAILGVVFGLVPSLQASLVPESTTFGWAYSALWKIGQAAIPINMLILGSTLSRGPSWDAVTKQVAVAMAFAKLVVMPALGLCAVILLRRVTAFADMSVPDAAWLSALVVLATPTANNLNVMCELAGQNSHAMATAIFMQYAAAPFAMIATVMVILLYVET